MRGGGFGGSEPPPPQEIPNVQGPAGESSLMTVTGSQKKGSLKFDTYNAVMSLSVKRTDNIPLKEPETFP